MSCTIKEIAQKANVSIATVSRALNNDPKVTEETRKRILAVSKGLNYEPNILARNFVKKKSNLLGLILPDITDEFFTEIIQGVDEITFKHGYFTIVVSSHKNRTLADSITTFSKNGLVGGIIILLSSMTKELKTQLKHIKIPFVLISGAVFKMGFDSVVIDNYQGAFNSTEYLINKKGFTRIAHITGPKDNDDANLRKKGFLDACNKNGVKVHKSHILEGDFSQEAGYKNFIRLFELSKKPQAIFAANDMMALGCFDAAKFLNLKIPEDVAVIGFDDIFVAQYLNPGLTTVRVQIEEVGRQAANLLINKLNREIKKIHQTIKVSANLIERGSC